MNLLKLLIFKTVPDITQNERQMVLSEIRMKINRDNAQKSNQ